jgi:hypothetical protein
VTGGWPFGGYKQSDNGREYGNWGIAGRCELRTRTEGLDRDFRSRDALVTGASRARPPGHAGGLTGSNRATSR